jgi:hypothetical protein
MSKGMFMPGSGVRMSLNRITPSGLNASQGCRLISTWGVAREGGRERGRRGEGEQVCM